MAMKRSTLVRTVGLVVMLVGIFVLPVTAAANLVQNGSFEEGYPGDNICGINWYEVGYGCNPSNTSIPSWLQTGGGVDWHDNTADPLEPAA
ncbi:MAG TPA: hypothetical protein VGH56_00595, partial [Solirubrobacteraceae bacterium]